MSVAYRYLGQLSIREGEQLKVKKGTDIRPAGIKKKSGINTILLVKES